MQKPTCLPPETHPQQVSIIIIGEGLFISIHRERSTWQQEVYTKTNTTSKNRFPGYKNKTAVRSAQMTLAGLAPNACVIELVDGRAIVDRVEYLSSFTLDGAK